MKLKLIICGFFCLGISFFTFSQEIIETGEPEQPLPAEAQSLPGQPAQPAQPQNVLPKITNEAVEYSAKEFAPWMYDLRRAEIIFVGAIPLTFFFVVEIFDTYRFVSHWDTRYAPWPFSVPEKIVYEEKEKINILVSAITSAALVAVADYIIGRMTGRRLAHTEK